MARSKKTSKIIDLSGTDKKASDKFEIKNYDYGVEQNNEDVQFEKDLDYLLNDQLTAETSNEIVLNESKEFNFDIANVSTDSGSKKKGKKKSKKINIDAITKDMNDIVFSSNDEGSDTELKEEVKAKVKIMNEVLEKQPVTSKKIKKSKSKKAPSNLTEGEKYHENGDSENKKSEIRENDAEFSKNGKELSPETDKNRKKDPKKKSKSLKKSEETPKQQNELTSKTSSKAKQNIKEEERTLETESEKPKTKKKNKSPKDKKEPHVEQPKAEKITIKQKYEDSQRDVEELTEDPSNAATGAKKSKKRSKKKSKSGATSDATESLKDELKVENIEPQDVLEEKKEIEKKKKKPKKEKQTKRDKEEVLDETPNKKSENVADKDSISEIESENKDEATSDSEDLMEPNGTFRLLDNLPDLEEKSDLNLSESSEGRIKSPKPGYFKIDSKNSKSHDNLNSESEFLGIKLKSVKHSGSSKLTDSLQELPALKTIIGLSKDQILKLNLTDVKIKTIVSSTSKSKYTSILLNFVLKNSHDLFENPIEKEMFISLCINVALYESHGFKKYTDTNPKILEIIDRFDEFKLENTRSKYTPSTKNVHKNDYDYTILSFIGHVILWAVHQKDSNNAPLFCKLSDINMSNDEVLKNIGGSYLWDKLKRHNTINSKRWKHIIKFRQHFTLDEDQFVLIVRMMKLGNEK